MFSAQIGHQKRNIKAKTYKNCELDIARAAAAFLIIIYLIAVYAPFCTPCGTAHAVLTTPSAQWGHRSDTDSSLTVDGGSAIMCGGTNLPHFQITPPPRVWHMGIHLIALRLT